MNLDLIESPPDNYMAGPLPESSLGDKASLTGERGLRDRHDPTLSHRRAKRRRDDNDDNVKRRGRHEDKGRG